MKKLLLVDGSSFLYRAYHALPDMRNPQGEPTGAVYGIFNMLRKLRQDYPADYSLCVFDAKGKTFRDDWYPDYKANRPSMPEDLAQQIEPINQLIAAAGWHVLALPGVEADDVIGTLAQQAAAAGVETLIATGDKDLAQLVNAHVTLINTMNNEVLDEAGVVQKFGVPPNRIIDFLTLTGDTVDNIPGVDKVGPKTAAKWLAQYDNLDALLAQAADVGGKVGENLRTALEWLPLSRRLVTIKCDVELPCRHDELTAPPQDVGQLRYWFERLNFRTWLRELNAAEPVPAAHPLQDDLFAAPATPAIIETAHYDCISSEAQLAHWLEKLHATELVALDTETDGLDHLQARLVGISFAVAPGEAAYLPLAHRYTGVPPQLDFAATLATLKPWLESPLHRKLGQNLKFDAHIFANHGITLGGIAEDTLLQSYVLESHQLHNMDSLAKRHLQHTTIAYSDVVGKGVKQIGFEQVDLETATRYAAEDADITLRLHQHFAPQLAAAPGMEHVYRAIELPVQRVLWVMERNGVLLDCPRLQQQGRELGTRLHALEQQATELAGQPFNLNSPKQLGEILFGKLGLPVVKKTPSGAPSTDEEVLQELALDYPLPKLLLEHRSLAKLKSTYTDKLPQMLNPTTRRVHTNYAQAVAVTGRLASSDPNLQNIPVRTGEGRRIREAFIAPPGSVLVSADYSQIELRIMAHLSGDAGLLRAFAQGEDVHRATAAEIFMLALDEVGPEQRRYAKAINFGLIYGMSAFGLARQLGIERSAAQAYIERYFARYPGVADYMERTRRQAKAQGYVETVFGRRLWLPDITASNGTRRQAAERAAINAPMQGTAADLIKLAMIAVQNWLETEQMQTRLIMQVHDELVLEVPSAELASVQQHLPQLMANVAHLRVPLLVEMGNGENWEAAH